MIKRLAALVVLALAAAVTTAPARASDPPAGPHFMRTELDTSPLFSYGSGNLTDHGGGVEAGGSVNYLIFVGMPATDPYALHLKQFFTDVTALPLYGVLAQYGVTGPSTFGGAWSDVTAGVPSLTITDAGLRTEVLRAMAANGWIGGLGNNFWVFTAPGVTVCSGSSCSGTSFCGYHSTMGDPANRETPYAAMPYPENTQASCGVTQRSPNLDPPADHAINIASHELFEILTDPGIGWGSYGWYDAAGYEVGDKCAWIYGPLLVPSTGGDTGTGTHWYQVQEEYSNAISDCRM